MVFLVFIYGTKKSRFHACSSAEGERDGHRDLNIAILANIRMVEAETRIVSAVS